MTEARDLAAKIFGRTLGRSLYALIKADWKKYGLEVITGDSLAEKLVVPIKKTLAKTFWPVEVAKMGFYASFWPVYVLL